MRTTLFFSILFFSSSAFAGDLSVCINGKGKLVAKAKCAKKETALTAKNLGGFGLLGAPGTPGPAGKNGTFDPSRCHFRESSATAVNTVNVSSFCLVNEVAVSGACVSDSSLAVAREASLLHGANGQFIETSYGGYACSMSTLDGSTQTVTAQAWCCQPQ